MKINANFSAWFGIVDARVWHACLGHLHMRLVHHLHNKGAIKISNKEPLSFSRDHCNMAKASEMPFFFQ